jgi:hypothetical protein
MKVAVGGSVVDVDESGFQMVPNLWVFSLPGNDLRRMVLLKWRYEFFLHQARQLDPDCDPARVMWESQESLCNLLGFTKASRTKCGKFLIDMEARGLISVIKERQVVAGKNVPKHFIKINLEKC